MSVWFSLHVNSPLQFNCSQNLIARFGRKIGGIVTTCLLTSMFAKEIII